MTWADIKKALADFFTPAELVELLDIDTEELVAVLEANTTVFDEQTIEELKELMQVGDDQ